MRRIVPQRLQLHLNCLTNRRSLNKRRFKIDSKEYFALEAQIVNELEGFLVCLVQHSFAVEEIENRSGVAHATESHARIVVRHFQSRRIDDGDAQQTQILRGRCKINHFDEKIHCVRRIKFLSNNLTKLLRRRSFQLQNLFVNFKPTAIKVCRKYRECQNFFIGEYIADDRNSSCTATLDAFCLRRPY